MKLFTLLLLSFIAFTSHLHAQGDHIETTPYSEFLNAKWPTGEEGFLQFIYQNVKYPKEARENCGMGKLIVEIEINEAGGLKVIEFKNPVKLGFGLEDEVVRLLIMTNGQWSKSMAPAKTKFSFVFSIEEIDKLKGDLTVVAYGSGGASNSCESSNTLHKQFAKYLEKEKYNALLPIAEELLRRHPDNEEYLRGYEKAKAAEGK